MRNVTTIKKLHKILKQSLILVSCALVPFFAEKAGATLIFKFVQAGPDVLFTATGSLNGITASSTGTQNSSSQGSVNTTTDVLRTASGSFGYNQFSLVGPTNPFDSQLGFVAAPFGTGTATVPFSFRAAAGTGNLYIRLIDTYVQGTGIASSFSLINQTLSSLGLTDGQFNVWTVAGASGDTIVLQAQVVPAPVPLLGAATAFGYSRRLRSRIRQRQKQPASLA